MNYAVPLLLHGTISILKQIWVADVCCDGLQFSLKLCSHVELEMLLPWVENSQHLKRCIQEQSVCVTSLSCDKLICQRVLLESGGLPLMRLKEHSPSF